MITNIVKLIQEGKLLYRLIHIVGHFNNNDLMRYLEITQHLVTHGYNITFRKDIVIFKNKYRYSKQQSVQILSYEMKLNKKG